MLPLGIFLAVQSSLLPPVSLIMVALASQTTAQTETLTTRGTVGVYASSPFFRFQDVQSVPGNTAISGPRWTLATVPSSIINVRCVVDRSPGTVILEEFGSGTLSSDRGGTTDLQSYPGPHTFVYFIPGAGCGNVVLEHVGITTGYSSIDVGDDNSPELGVVWPFSNPARVVVPVRFTSGLPISITAFSGVGMAVGYSHRITVRFERGCPAAVTPYGTACNATLTGSDTFAGGQHQLSFLVRGQPSSLIAVLFGLNPVQIPIFGTNCEQLTDLVNFAILPANALGEATFGFTLPGPLQGDVRMQALSWTPVPTLTATSGLRVVLAD